MKTKRAIAIQIIITMLINLFLPYSVLLTKSYAAVTVPNPAAVITPMTDQLEDDGIVQFAIGITGDYLVYGTTFFLRYDTSILTPARYNKSKKMYVETTSLSSMDPITGDWSSNVSEDNSWLFADTGEIRIQTADGVGFNPKTSETDVKEDYDFEALDEQYNGFFPVAILTFLVSESFDVENITKDVIKIVPDTYNSDYYTGFSIEYEDDGNERFDDIAHFKYDGFNCDEEKVVTGISVKTNPSKMTYNHNDSLELDDGELEVTYEDGGTETISMKGTGVSCSSSKADVNNKTLTFTYEGKQVTLDITVNDPVDKLEIVKTMNNTEYPHDQNIDFSGLELKATTLSGKEIKLDKDSEGLGISETKADVNSANFTQTNTGSPKRGKQKIEFSYGGQSVSTTIIVNDTIASVLVKTQPTKKVYKRGESLDLTTGKLEVTMASGDTTPVELSDGNVSVIGYNDTKTGVKQKLKVSFGGVEASNTIDVEVYNYIKDIILIPPSNRAPNYNENLDLSDASITEEWADDVQKADIDVLDSYISDYTKTKLETQTVKVTYPITYTLSDGTKINDKFEKTFTVKVHNNVTGITIKAPTKPIYNHGESLDLTGGKITVSYAYGPADIVNMTTSMITEADGTTAVNMSPAATDYGADKTLSKTLKITYEEDGISQTQDYPITIINDIKQISVHSTNHKTEYNVKENLDITNLEILVKRATGTDSVFSVNQASMVSGFKNDKNYTNLPLTITYTENNISQTCSYNVNVTDTVTKIELETTPKQAYKYNEDLDLDNRYITVTKGSGTSRVKIDSTMVTGYDKTKLGDQKITVSYGGKDTEYTVNVKDYVTGITIKPASVTGSVNDTMADLITANNMKYVVTYAKAGDQDEQDLVDTMVVGYSSTSKTTQNLKVNYVDNDDNSFTKGSTIKGDLAVTLLNTVKTVSIDVPTTPSYNHGGSIDLSKGKINLVYADNTKGTLPLSDATITETDGSTPVNMSPSADDYDSTTHKYSKTVKITYTAPSGATDTQNYTFDIINDIQQVSVHSTNHKTEYNVKEKLDLTNLQISVTRAVGVASIVTVTDEDMISGFKSDKEYTDLPLTITYTENGIPQTCTYTINVTDTVTKIEIKTNPKQNYKYGDSLNVSTGKITVTRGSGTENLEIEPGWVTEEDGNLFDSTNLTSRNLKVTYGGKSITYPITVKDYVTDIEVIPNDIMGRYNDELLDVITKNNVKYKVTYAKAGEQDAQELKDNMSMISGTYSKAKLTKQNLKVTYTDNDENSFTNGDTFTKDLDITLKKSVTKIEITAPTDVKFNHGNQLTYGGGNIKVSYNNNTSENVAITDAMVKEKDGSNVNMSPEAADYEADHTLTKTLTITYEEDGVTQTKDYDITIINDIKQISVYSTNHKNDYNLNEPLDITNLEILVHRAIGTDSVVPITNTADVTGFNSIVENPSLPLTVKYEENGIPQTCTYNVKVENKVIKIEMKTTPKQNYKYNEELEVLGGYITATFGNGPQDVAITSDMVTGYNKEQLGEQELTVTYKGKTTKYKVNVKDYVKEIIVNPNNVTGIIGDTLENIISKKNIKYKVVYAKVGSKPEENLARSMVVGSYDDTRGGAQTLDVIYTDTDEDSFTKDDIFTKPLTITLQEKISSIEIETKPKDEYNYGESLDVTDGVLKIIKENGSTTMPMSADMVTEMDGTPFNSKKLGTRDLLVTYSGKTTKYEITVKDYVEDIIITKPDKLIYNIGESLSLTGGQVSCKMASGATKDTVDLESHDVQVSGFDSSKEGTCTITVKYKGKTKTFGVTIQDPVNGIAINTLPDKLDYLYGDKLKLIGGTITINKYSGPKVIDMSASGVSVSGYEPTKLGTQTITVTYQGFTDSFSVNVEDFVSKLKVKAPQKVEYEYGEEELSLEKGSASIVMASGAIKETVNLSETTLSEFNPKQVGKQTIKVKYKDLEGSFTVNVTDKIKGIIVKTYPNKVNYNKGDKLDLTGATIDVVKSSGIVNIPITKDMISGYDSSKLGSQTIDVTYGGFSANFVVKVGEVQKTTTNKKPTKTQKVVEEPVDEPEEVIEPIPEEPQEEKPTETLGVRDEKKEDGIDIRIIAGIIGGAGLLLLLIIAAARRYNVKIYVEQDGKYVLAGVDRISRKDPVIDVDKYLNVNEYSSRVKIYLSKSIAHKLDEEDIEIIHREKVLSQRIVYRNEVYKIIIE